MIDTIEFSDYGFSDTDTNGEILSVEPSIIIKTNNGPVALTGIRTGKEFFIKGKILQ